MNDGVLPEGVRHFDQPGSEIVSFGIQTLGGFNNVQPYQGWFTIEILQPVQLQSQKVDFDVICRTPSTGGAPPAPQTLQAENDTAATDEEDTAATTTAPEEGDTTGEGEEGGLPTEESTEESTEEPDEGEGNTGEDTGGTPPPSTTDQEPSSLGDDTGG
jgi:hypothetical protein